MKKVLIFILCTMMLCLISLTVVADSDVQFYNLNMLGDNTLVFTAENAAAFWEKPVLKAGESTVAPGTLIVRNSTAAEQKIGLHTVELPYDNDEALRYLNHLHITVRDGNTILYEGVYSRINDDRDFSLNTELQPGAQVTFSIDLRCDYTYEGTGFAANDLIKWEFYAVTEAIEVEEDHPLFSNPALYEILVACGVSIAMLGGIFLYDRFLKKR